MESQKDYLERRARQEREAAERASDARARELHLELAARYLQASADDPHRRSDRAPVPPPGFPRDFSILE